MIELKKQAKFAEIEALAKEGDAEAQCVLGDMYYDGDGAPQDYKQAAYWYKKSAKQGNADAQYELAEMCKHGAITPKDYLKAAERGGWTEKAKRFLKLHELFLKLHELEAKQND